MNKPLTLSIIIPAYNEEHHLKDCLDSIAKQSVMPDEVIVVDNNSIDRTAVIAQKYSFVRLISEKKQGIAHAHHAGFAVAQGDYIGRIDADSVLPNNWVESIHEFYQIEEHKNVAMTGSGYFKNVRLPVVHQLLIDSAFIATRLLLGYSSMWGPNMVLPCKAWAAIAHETCTEKSTTYDDFDIALHLHSKGIRTKWIRTLRVGARVKYIHSPRKFLQYMLRWPGTLRNHHDLRWIIAWAGSIVMFITQYPILFLLKRPLHE